MKFIVSEVKNYITYILRSEMGSNLLLDSLTIGRQCCLRQQTGRSLLLA